MHYTQPHLVEQKSLEIQGDQKNKNLTNVFVANEFLVANLATGQTLKNERELSGPNV